MIPKLKGWERSQWASRALGYAPWSLKVSLECDKISEWMAERRSQPKPGTPTTQMWACLRFFLCCGLNAYVPSKFCRSYCCCCSIIQLCLTLVTTWTAVHHASLSITTSQSLLKLTSIELVMPSNHVILWVWCHLHICGYWYFSRQSWFQLVLLPAQPFSWWTLHIS